MSADSGTSPSIKVWSFPAKMSSYFFRKAVQHQSWGSSCHWCQQHVFHLLCLFAVDLPDLDERIRQLRQKR